MQNLKQDPDLDLGLKYGNLRESDSDPKNHFGSRTLDVITCGQETTFIQSRNITLEQSAQHPRTLHKHFFYFLNFS
jgi:hypothetical protein